MFAYTKTIVCLSNSRKISGRCIAGKEYVNGQFRDWIRPVSGRHDEEISEEDRRYQTGDYAKLLHIVTIPMIRPVPEGFQGENHLIDEGFYWVKKGVVVWSDLVAAVDVPSALWIDGYSTYNGINDRIPEKLVHSVDSSLLLLGPLRVTLDVAADDADFGNQRRRVRAFFRHHRTEYSIAVTDPVIERDYLRHPDGRYTVDEAIICVSLGKVWKGFADKLVAAVITPARAR